MYAIYSYFLLCHVQYIPSTSLFTASWIFQSLPFHKCLLHSLGLSLPLCCLSYSADSFFMIVSPRMEYLLVPDEPERRGENNASSAQALASLTTSTRPSMCTHLHQGRPISRTAPYSRCWNVVSDHNRWRSDNLKHK